MSRAGWDRPAGPVLMAHRLHKEYGGGGGPLKVLKGVDLEVLPGETVGIVGRSGSGKSTLLHLLGGLDRPNQGQVVLGDWHLNRLSDIELSRVRSRLLGFVFQFHHLLLEFSALENVALPLRIQGAERGEAEERARRMLVEVGLAERLTHRPNALSGGEQQRVAFARALVHEPILILADEPSGNLDRANSEHLHDLMFVLAREKRVAFVVATHDERLAERTDRLLQIEDGLLAPVIEDLAAGVRAPRGVD
ncbi:MAG TPA: ABC transporter ATP-binding protein [Gemmatimonadota bacterium]|nr:ABC transporter ATP-binding protein [Gemmatimonadota bacterium]